MHFSSLTLPRSPTYDTILHHPVRHPVHPWTAYAPYPAQLHAASIHPNCLPACLPACSLASWPCSYLSQHQRGAWHCTAALHCHMMPWQVMGCCLRLNSAEGLYH